MICRLPVLFVAALFLSTSEPVRSQESILSALPDDVVFVAQIADAAETCEKLKTTPFYAVTNLPEVKPIIERLETMFVQARAEAKAETGFDPWDLISSMHGEVVVAYGSLKPMEKALTAQLSGADSSMTSEDLALLFIVDAGKEKETLRSAIGKMLDLGRKEGAKIETTPFHGGEFTQIATAPNESGGTAETVYLAEQGSRFLVGFNKGLVEQVSVNLASGKASGLTKDSRFVATREATGKESDMFVFVNLGGLVASVDTALSTTFFGFFWQQFRSLVVGQSLNSFGAGVQFREQGIRQTMFVHNDGAKDGVLGWFSADAISPKPAPFTPENATTFSSAAIDISRVFGFLRSLAQMAMSVQGGGDVDALFEQQLGVKFADLQRAFGDRVDVFGSKVAAENDPFEPDETFVVSLKDAEPVKKLMGTLEAASAGDAQSEDYQGQKILSFASDDGIKPGVSVTDDRLIFSFEVENVKKVIRRAKSASTPVADATEFKKASAQSPGKVNFFRYTSAKHQQQFQTFFPLLAQGIVATLTERTEGLPPNLEEALVAAMNHLVQSLGDTFSWGVWQGPGFYIEGGTAFAGK